MVLERSFDANELKQMLAGSDMVMDKELGLCAERRDDPSRISRPPLPKGSQVFEKVLDEFQPERLGPEIRVQGPSSLLRAPSPNHLKPPSAGRLRPRSPAGARSHVSSRANSPVHKPSSPRHHRNVPKRHNSPQPRPRSAVKELLDMAASTHPVPGGVEVSPSC